MDGINRLGEGGRALLWIAANDNLLPSTLTGWQRFNLADISGISPGQQAYPNGYVVLFEATCNSTLKYDPVVQARAVWSRSGRAPDVLVALVAPSLEIPVAAQHAIAHEVGIALHSPRVDVVTVTEQWTKQSEQKRRKADTGSSPDYHDGSSSALAEALDIVAGRKRGKRVDKAAENFVYAYSSRAARRTPFRCTRLQREILHVVASGAIAPTTSAIARSVYAAERKVDAAISELVTELAPRAAGEPELRDSRERLYWLMHHYGVWIRLVDGRE